MTPTTRQALDQWLAEDTAGARRQSPVDELLAEHHLMAVVLSAMEAEAEALLGGRSLREEFWSDLVDFNGNFVHLCHRVKEEKFLIPALVAHGLLGPEQQQAIHREHESGKDLTLAICSGVEEADWEKVMRVVAIYVHILQPHMRHEEAGIFALASSLPPATTAELRHDFDELDRKALGDPGRRHYLTTARRLAIATGIVPDLPE